MSKGNTIPKKPTHSRPKPARQRCLYCDELKPLSAFKRGRGRECEACVNAQDATGGEVKE